MGEWLDLGAVKPSEGGILYLLVERNRSLMETGVCSIARFRHCTRDQHDKSIGGGVREWGIFLEVETRQDGEG